MLLFAGIISVSYVIGIAVELLHCWLDDRAARR
jgi:hypothetical protein